MLRHFRKEKINLENSRTAREYIEIMIDVILNYSEKQTEYEILLSICTNTGSLKRYQHYSMLRKTRLTLNITLRFQISA